MTMTGRDVVYEAQLYKKLRKVKSQHPYQVELRWNSARAETAESRCYLTSTDLLYG